MVTRTVAVCSAGRRIPFRIFTWQIRAHGNARHKSNCGREPILRLSSTGFRSQLQKGIVQGMKIVGGEFGVGMRARRAWKARESEMALRGVWESSEDCRGALRSADNRRGEQRNVEDRRAAWELGSGFGERQRSRGAQKHWRRRRSVVGRWGAYRCVKKNRTRGVDRGTWSREERKRAEMGQENHRYRVACEKCEM